MAKFKRPREEEHHVVDGDNVHPSRQKRVKYSEEDAQLAKLYSNLADDVQAVRIKAAGDLLKNLSASSSAQSQRLDNAESRLIRGLCSGRKAARLGFSIALTELFRLKFKVEAGAKDIVLVPTIDKIIKSTEVEGNVSGQQKRDHLIGRRFAYLALLQSDVGLDENLSDAQWADLMRAIFELAGSKQWLRREVGAMLHDYLVSSSGAKLNESRVRAVLDTAASSKLLKTPEGVGLWLTLQDRFPGVALPKGVWHHNDPLSSKERQVLSKVLLENSIDDDPSAAKGGSRQSTPGFAWTVILSRLFKEGSVKPFAKFWDSCVASPMFSSSSSTERRSLGLQIFSLALSTAPAETLPDVFHANILRCILDQRASSERYLFDAAKAPLNQMINRAKQSPPLAGVLVQELHRKGSVSFDQSTKTKTVETIIGIADDQSLSAVVINLQQMVSEMDSASDGQAETRRRSLADTLLMIVRSHKDAAKSLVMRSSTEQPKDTPWLERLLSTLVTCAYARSASTTVFRSRLMSCLNSLMDSPPEQAVKGPVFVALQLRSQNQLRQRMSDPRARDGVENGHSCLNDTIAKQKKSKTSAVPRAFALLFALSILQVYNEEADSVAALEDLVTCYQSSKDDDEDSMTMLIELLLSFVSKQSGLFRKLAEQVFGAFAPEINIEGLQSLIDILGQKEGMSGQQELFDRDGGEGEEGEASGDEDEDNDDDDMEDVEDVEDASDVELVNGEEVAGSQSGDEDSGDSEGTSSDAEQGAEDKDDENDEEVVFNRKLAEALGTGNDDSDDSGDGSDMDDEQMMALEPHLASIFKERQNQTSKKQEKKDAKENIVNFKNRVLDLLMIYVKCQYDSVLALDLIHPLATLVRTTSSKPTAEKAVAVMKAYFDACTKHKSLPQPDDAEAVFEVLAAVHEEIKSGGSKLHAGACSRASLFLARVLVAMEREHYERIAGMYAKLMSEWYQNAKSRVQGSVFTEWTSWSISTRGHT